MEGREAGGIVYPLLYTATIMGVVKTSDYISFEKKYI